MPTSNPVPSQDPSDLLFNAAKLDEVISGTASTFIDRKGVQRRTLAGIDAAATSQRSGIEAAAVAQRTAIQDAADLVLSGIGYAPPVAYAAGISLTLQTQTVEYQGEVYAPKVSVLPFTTGGTFETAKFRLIQGVASAELSASSGSSMVGYDGGMVQDVLDSTKPVADYTALRAYKGRATSIRITTLGIAGFFRRDDSDTTSADNGGTAIVDASGRRWKRLFEGAFKVTWFGVTGDGSDETAKLAALFAAMPENNFTVDFCNLTISVGNFSAKQIDRFTFTNRRGIKFINVGKITATNNIYTAGYPDWSSVFKFVNCSNLDIDITTEFSELTTQTGMICPIEIQTTTSATGDQTNYKIRSYTKYGHAALLINRPQDELNATPMPRPMAYGFKVDLYNDFGNYGLITVYNGHQVTGDVRTKRIGRSYFCVDSSGHNVNVISEDHRIITDVLIKSYFSDIRGITVDYSGTGDISTSGSIFTIEFQNDAQNTSITDVFARISSDKDAVAIHPQILLNRQFDSVGNIQTTTNSRIDNIHLDLLLSGVQRYDVDTVKVEAKQAKRGSVILSGKKFNTTSTNGLTFVRGDAMISMARGPYITGSSGTLFFDLEGLYGDWTGHGVLEIVADADFTTTIYEAYQKWAFRVYMDTSGAVLTVTNLTKIEERLFDETNSPVVTAGSNLTDFLLRFNVAWGRNTTELSRLHGKLTLIADAI